MKKSEFEDLLELYNKTIEEISVEDIEKENKNIIADVKDLDKEIKNVTVRIEELENNLETFKKLPNYFDFPEQIESQEDKIKEAKEYMSSRVAKKETLLVKEKENKEKVKKVNNIAKEVIEKAEKNTQKENEILNKKIEELKNKQALFGIEIKDKERKTTKQLTSEEKIICNKIEKEIKDLKKTILENKKELNNFKRKIKELENTNKKENDNSQKQNNHNELEQPKEEPKKMGDNKDIPEEENKKVGDNKSVAQEENEQVEDEKDIPEEKSKKTESNNIEKDEVLEKYKSEGFGQNAFGWYFNPWIDEYDKDYDPHNDETYNINIKDNTNSQDKVNHNGPEQSKEKPEDEQDMPEEKNEQVEGEKDIPGENEQVEGEKNISEENEIEYEDIDSGRKSEVNKIKISPISNSIICEVSDKTGVLGYKTRDLDYTDKYFESDEIQDIIEECKKDLGEKSLSKITKKLDPNILSMLDNNNKEQLLEYVRAVHDGTDLPFDLEYDLKDMYKSDELYNKEKSNINKVAKGAKDLEGAEVLKDGIFKRTFDKVNSLISKYTRKRLVEDNKTYGKYFEDYEGEASYKVEDGKSSILDKAKEKASDIGDKSKEKVSDIGDKVKHFTSEKLPRTTRLTKKAIGAMKIAGINISGYFRGENPLITKSKARNVRNQFVNSLKVDNKPAKENSNETDTPDNKRMNEINQQVDEIEQENNRVIIEHPDGTVEYGTRLGNNEEEQPSQDRMNEINKVVEEIENENKSGEER